MLPNEDDSYEGDYVSLVPHVPSGRVPGPVIAFARSRLSNLILAGDGEDELHQAFSITFEGTRYKIEIRQVAGGYKLIFEGDPCKLGMDSGLVLYDGDFLDSISDSDWLDSPGNPASPSTPGTVHGDDVRKRDSVTDYHPWGGDYRKFTSIVAETMTPPGGATKDSVAFQYKDGQDETANPKKVVLFTKKKDAQIAPSSMATGLATRMLIQGRFGRRVRDFKEDPPYIASSNWNKGNYSSNGAPVPSFLHGLTGYIIPSCQSGSGLHLDSKYNVSLITIDHKGAVGQAGAVDHCVRVTRLKLENCVKSARTWLNSEAGGDATDEERQRVLTWMLAYTKTNEDRKDVVVHTMSDKYATSFYEDNDGEMTGVIGDITHNGQNNSFPWTNTAGYGWKFSKDGRRAARVGFHSSGAFTAANPDVKRTNGDITVTEHEMLFDRDPDTDESSETEEDAKELLHWTVTENQVNQVQYNTWDSGLGALRGVIVSATAAWTSDALTSTAADGTIYSRLLVGVPPAMSEEGIYGPDPAASFSAPTGVIPWYVIGYDDDDAYHRIDIDATNNVWYLVKRESDGTESKITNDLFVDENGINAYFDITTDPLAWTVVVPLDNAECVYFREVSPQSYPTTVYRYTPRDGITDSLSIANGGDFFKWVDNNYSHYDRQAALSGVHAGRSSGYTSGGFDLSEDYDTASVDLEQHPWQYVFVGFE